jgi:hypothetical protein
VASLASSLGGSILFCSSLALVCGLWPSQPPTRTPSLSTLSLTPFLPYTDLASCQHTFTSLGFLKGPLAWLRSSLVPLLALFRSSLVPLLALLRSSMIPLLALLLPL